MFKFINRDERAYHKALCELLEKDNGASLLRYLGILDEFGDNFVTKIEPEISYKSFDFLTYRGSIDLCLFFQSVNCDFSAIVGMELKMFGDTSKLQLQVDEYHEEIVEKLAEVFDANYCFTIGIAPYVGTEGKIIDWTQILKMYAAYADEKCYRKIAEALSHFDELSSRNRKKAYAKTEAWADFNQIMDMIAENSDDEFWVGFVKSEENLIKKMQNGDLFSINYTSVERPSRNYYKPKEFLEFVEDVLN